MKFECLPNDIHYHIMNQLESNNDLLNLGKTCKTLQKEINNNIKKVKAELFRVKITLKIDADLNKHCRLCKKFSNLKYYFNENFFRLNFDRRTNHTIFDTTTLIYFNIFLDDLNKFNYTFLKFLKDYDLCKTFKIHNLEYELLIYINHECFKFIKRDNLDIDREDIVFDNKSLTNINQTYNQINKTNVINKTNEFERFERLETLERYNPNIVLNNLDTKNFIDILIDVNKNNYEIKKKINTDNKNIYSTSYKKIISYEDLLNINNFLVIKKIAVMRCLNSLITQNTFNKNNINKEIHQELESYMPNTTKVDNLIKELDTLKKNICFLKNIKKYLMFDEICYNNYPILEN